MWGRNRGSREVSVVTDLPEVEETDRIQAAHLLMESLRDAAAQGRLIPHAGWSMTVAGRQPRQVFAIEGAPSPSFVVVQRSSSNAPAVVNVQLCHLEQSVLTPPGRTAYMGVSAPCQLQMVDVLVPDWSLHTYEQDGTEVADGVMLTDYCQTEFGCSERLPLRMPDMTQDALRQFTEDITSPVPQLQTA